MILNSTFRDSQLLKVINFSIIVLISSTLLTAQINIAPQATITAMGTNAPGCQTGACSTLNDLNLGTCGSQQMWISTATPPSSAIGADWIQWDWPAPKTFDTMIIHHAQNNARFLTGALIQSWNGSAWVTEASFSNLPMQCINKIGFPRITTSRMRITQFLMQGTGQLSNPNFREIEIISAPNGPNDAGVSELISPVNFCPGTQDIIVQVKNFGINIINGVTLNYTINGALQAPINIPTPLDTLNGSTPISVNVNLGTYTFAANQTINLKAWTSNPNGVQDTIPINDTLTAALRPSVSGTYTIGSTGADFTTFSAALSLLENVGICGPVIFNVKPGSYNEQITVKSYQGASATNTVTFKAENNDSNSVVLQFESSLAAANYTINFSGGKFVTFRNMTIRASGSTYGTVIRLEGNANNNSIRNSVLESSLSAATTSTNFAIVFDISASNEEYNVFSNNNMRGGSYGFYMWGSGTTSHTRGTVIEYNTMNPYYMGIYLNYQKYPVIHGNTIRTTDYATSYGIYAINGDSGIAVTANRVHLQLGAYGIYLSSVIGSAANPGLVANNFVVMEGTGTAYGLYFAGTTTYLNVYHNSVNVLNTSATGGRGIYYTATGANNNVVNNIFVNTGGGYAAYYGNTALAEVDHNDYYVSDGNFAYWGANRADLSALQTASGKDANSISLNPYFESPYDLHANLPVNDKGKPVGVLTDIDDEPRSTTTPDIGADELVPAPFDLTTKRMFSPVEACGLSSAETVSVMVFNFGLNTLPTGTQVPIKYSINNGPVVSEKLVLLKPYNPLDTAFYTFTAKANLADSGVYVIKVWTDLPNENKPINDTNIVTIRNILIKNYPYIENFETFAIASTEGFPNGWKNDPAADQPWRPNVGTTPNNSGPFYDFNPKSLSGTYLYSNTGAGATGAEFRLWSPCLDLSNLTHPGFDIAYYMNGAATGSFSVDVIADGTLYPDYRIIEGPQGPNWEQMAVPLDTFKAFADIVQLQFRAIKGGINADIALDDFRIGELPQIAIPDSISDCGFVKLDAGNPGSTYSWSTGDTTRYLLVKSTTFTTTQVISLTVTNEQGIRNFKTIPVTLSPGPVVDLGEDQLICDQTSLTLDAGVQAGTILWDNGTSNQTRVVTASGTYFVRVDDNTGCIKYDTIQVDFEQQPVATFVANDDPSNSFINFSSAGSSGTTYTWYFGDGNGSNEQNPDHYYKIPGTYNVMLIVSNACGSDTMTLAVSDVNVGLEDIAGITDLDIYPNPSDGLVNISLQLAKVGDIHIELFNVQGQIIRSEKSEGVSNIDKVIDLSAAPKGVYYIKITADGESIVKKIVLQ